MRGDSCHFSSQVKLLKNTESEDEKDKLQVYYYITHTLMEGQHNNDEFVSDLRWRVRNCIYN